MDINFCKTTVVVSIGMLSIKIVFMCFAYFFLPSLGNSKITIEKASKFEHLPHVHKILKKNE